MENTPFPYDYPENRSETCVLIKYLFQHMKGRDWVEFSRIGVKLVRKKRKDSWLREKREQVVQRRPWGQHFPQFLKTSNFRAWWNTDKRLMRFWIHTNGPSMFFHNGSQNAYEQGLHPGPFAFHVRRPHDLCVQHHLPLATNGNRFYISHFLIGTMGK